MNINGCFKGLFKGFLIFISYHSIKKVIGRYPEPYKRMVIFLFRLAVFFIIFLTLFSFFTGRIYSIASNIQSPGIVINILVGISFIFSLIISYLLTAVIEEIYRKLSEVKQQAQENIEAVKDKAQIPARVIKNTVTSTKTTIVKTSQFIGDNSRKLYDSTLKITNATVDLSVSKFNNIFQKKGKKQSSEKPPNPN
jgi:predicted membrane protein